MVEYTCEKCKKVFTKKSTYVRHTERKNPCDTQIGKVTSEDYICTKCNKTYSSYQCLHRHYKKCKKVPNVQNIMMNIDNRTNIDNTQNNQVKVDGDVKVVKFGNENLSYISDDIFKQILGRGFKSVEELIDHSHFNAAHPENHNIYIANIKDDYIIMYDGSKWIIDKKDNVMEDIIYAKSDFLNLKFKELMGEMSAMDIKKFNNFINKRDEDKTMNRLKEELKLQLYNNRYMPQKMRKVMEKNNKLSTKSFDERCLKIKSALENMMNNINASNINDIERILNEIN